MFTNVQTFNGDISKWNMSSVTDMNGMFSYVVGVRFSSDLSKWDVSHMMGMGGMFSYVSGFNGDLSNRELSSVNDIMTEMFSLRHLTVTPQPASNPTCNLSKPTKHPSRPTPKPARQNPKSVFPTTITTPPIPESNPRIRVFANP